MATLIGMAGSNGRPISGVDHLRQSLQNILTTRLGSRRMRPEFGSNIYQFVDKPVSEGWKSALMAEAARAITRWEPRIKLGDRAVRLASINDGQVVIVVSGEYLGDNVVVEVTV